MDDDLADLESVLEPHVRPRLTAVGGFGNAGAVRKGVAWIVLTRAHPDDLRVGRSDADIADGDCILVIELMLKSDAVVFRLEQAARCRGHPVNAGILFINRQ